LNNGKSEFLWNVHQYINEYIRFADTKAAAVIAWAGAVIGTLVATESHQNFLDGRLWGGTWLIAWVTLLALVLLGIGFVFAILVIAPILTYNRAAPKNLIFWDAIRAFSSFDEYSTAVRDCNDVEGRVAQHVYELAGIARRKYRKTQFSIAAAAIGTLFAIVAILGR